MTRLEPPLPGDNRQATLHPHVLKRERFLIAGIVTAVAFCTAGEVFAAAMTNPVWLALIFAWLFVSVLGCALAVVRHAEHLAGMLGEPVGTLLLTLSVTVIEVISVSAVMLHGEANPTLARDTLFSVVMLILNGMVGLSLLIGGWRHSEQNHNLQGANVYLGAVIPLVVLSLVLPDFTLTTAGPTLSAAQQVFLVLTSVGLYALFLAMQSGRHRNYFSVDGESAGPVSPVGVRDPSLLRKHAALLVAHLAIAAVLAEQLAHPVDHAMETFHAPSALGGLVMAILVATPEAIGAVRAALANQLQRSVNIFLGSVLSTIGITVPAIVLVSRCTGQNIVLGVEHGDLVMLLLTLVVSIVTFSSRRTNVIQGAVHLILFAGYLLLIFRN